jgi:hypothetical protein
MENITIKTVSERTESKKGRSRVHKKYSIKNRNLKKSFQKYLRPDLRDKITTIEDANWIIMYLIV